VAGKVVVLICTTVYVCDTYTKMLKSTVLVVDFSCLREFFQQIPQLQQMIDLPMAI